MVEGAEEEEEEEEEEEGEREDESQVCKRNDTIHRVSQEKEERRKAAYIMACRPCLSMTFFICPFVCLCVGVSHLVAVL